MADEPRRGELAQGVIGLPGLVAQSVGLMAPQLSAVVFGAAVAAYAGASTPLAFLIAGIRSEELVYWVDRSAKCAAGRDSRKATSCLRPRGHQMGGKRP